ncbi:MAG: M91 family zinc metallopeptidase [Gemmataceae bacterium]|nr:M91 family zinc metallopeptidase [Gemmataceae bacterium]MCI0742924.1 M91 family zinc metallopeptidase [Gemmataceae bacterium]
MAKVYGITIDGNTPVKDTKAGSTRIDPKLYEEEVTAQLHVIFRNQVGRLVLHYIKTNDDDLKIVPYSDRDSIQAGHCNDFVRAENPQHARKKDEVIPIPGSSRSVKGTGKGSNATVHFTPDGLRKSRCQTKHKVHPDDILVHELVHGLRMMDGRLTKAATTGKLEDYDDEEEYLAIVVANIYLSAKLGSQANNRLRADHHGFDPLLPPFNTSAGFLSEPENVAMLAKFYVGEYDLLQGLGDIDVPFNPVRELIQNGAKYKQTSISPRRRD